MNNITFANPEFFWLLLVIPALAAWYYYKRKDQMATLKVSSVNGFKVTPSLLARLKPLLFVLRMLALTAIIVALARPQSTDVTNKTRKSRGIDIVMAVDVSGSMLARDLKPNRLVALKAVASEFVSDRPNDRIGIVVYASEAYTKTPVTSDKAVVLDAIKSIKYDNVLQDGTAIGVGLATAINRIKDSDAKSKVIILLTDGVNNSGFIDPRMAAEIAKEFGIKVYTIGIGTNGMAEFPVSVSPNGQFNYQMMKVEIDEGLMQEIAKTTDGVYFRATDNKSLEKIYDEIDELETSEVEELRFMNYDDKFRSLVILSFILLGIELILRKTLYRSFI
ncbi:VWA domain-containing protein [Flavobacterium agricola]|uniref:VWA domain-containing protein n=1 Tax=Flavobacterium agricola TaxID=2870839 RepID=A0ABY6M0W5_9FLAO|nr:VWA domain-containing protein [Flavobacterium agricola]UYW01060.1 VWA domain-containing protein [Flavobacterium agricola]